MGSPPLQELIWILVRPLAALSKSPSLFYITAYLPVTHLIALILHAPSRSLRALSFYHCLAKSFSKERWSQENIFQTDPSLSPCIPTMRSCLGRLRSAKVSCTLVLNIAPSAREDDLLFSSNPEIILSPSFACDETPLSLFPKKSVCGQ